MFEVAFSDLILIIEVIISLIEVIISEIYVMLFKKCSYSWRMDLLKNKLYYDFLTKNCNFQTTYSMHSISFVDNIMKICELFFKV